MSEQRIIQKIAQICKINKIKDNLFNCDDYKTLNKDLIFQNDDEYITHWEMIGLKQRRLCNKNQLIVTNEFGIEILMNVGYYYYLFLNNLFFDNKIITYKGMRPFYFFLNDDQIIEREDIRQWNDNNNNPIIFELRRSYSNIDTRCWIPPNYKLHFKNNYFDFSNKKIIVIHNKYNIEWNIKPYNFIPFDILEKIFILLAEKYQIVYIRPTNSMDNKLDYSWDNNKNLDLGEIDVIKNNYPNVMIFEDLFNDDKFKNMTYNQLKACLYSSTDDYISVQGGGNNFMAYFAKTMIVYHKRGYELGAKIYSNRSQLQCPSNNLKIDVAQDYDTLIELIKNTYL